ncbi:hypothetical protein HYW17_04545 [Candidatus Uhrbacteria bacterium]|nr:hypothetical protein [Candidatus Uhrbacteria bacterium]
MLSHARGQGLLETVVAIGIITTGLFSVITLVISNLTTQREAAFRYQAMNFAREGVELARNIRDSNWLTGQDDVWAGLPAGQLIPQFAIGEAEIRFEPAQTGSRIIYQCEDGSYAQGRASCTAPTPFSRTVTLDILPCGEEETVPCEGLEGLPSERRARIAMRVTVEVAWIDQERPRSVELSQLLYDWR